MNAFVYVLEFKSANHESGDQISSFLKKCLLALQSGVPFSGQLEEGDKT